MLGIVNTYITYRNGLLLSKRALLSLIPLTNHEETLYLFSLSGHINGVILFQETPVLFGSKISCSPDMHCLRPGQKEIFVISFSNPNQGPYFEETRFVIRDTNITLKLYLK